MEKPQTWQELLRSILRDSQEKQRIANELGVSIITLNRWVAGESRPRPQNLRILLKILPQYREQLAQLLSSEYNDMLENSEESYETAPEIPVELYSRIFKTYTNQPKLLLFDSITSLILEQAINHLDPDKLGMSLVIAKCMPPNSDGKTHTLRETIGRGTPPWSFDLEKQNILLGVESLAGYAAMSGRPAVQNTAEDRGPSLSYSQDFTASQISHPILRSDHIAGCLLISSTQPGYFTPARLALVAEYAALLSIAFDDVDFYPLTNIDLRAMPSYRLQASYFSSFRSRVTEIIREMTKEQNPITFHQAEEIAWKQIEQELLDLAQENLHKPDDKLIDNELSTK